MNDVREPERVETVVIGGGQTGLSVGYHLARRGLEFVILDAHPRVGDAWRNRWDPLRLFTPGRFSGLAGMPFPGPRWSFPTKDEMADYVEAYAERFDLPVRTGVRVDRLARDGDGYLVASGDQRWRADNVVVAMNSYQRPRVRPFADQLAPEIVQLHSYDYRNRSRLRDGPVLVVGAGNSGAEIALEAAGADQAEGPGRGRRGEGAEGRRGPRRAARAGRRQHPAGRQRGLVHRLAPRPGLDRPARARRAGADPPAGRGRRPPWVATRARAAGTRTRSQERSIR
jgi:putative flavoprotein involved in K+ transport